MEDKKRIKMRIKSNVILLVGLLLVLNCKAKTLKDDGNVFMEALKVSDADKSFNMIDISIQREVGGMEGWKTWIQNRKPIKWEFTNLELKGEINGQLQGNADFSTGQHLDVQLNFEKSGDDWKIIGIDFKSEK